MYVEAVQKAVVLLTVFYCLVISLLSSYIMHWNICYNNNDCSDYAS